MQAAQPLWSPDDARVRRTQMQAFIERVSKKYGVAAEWEAVRRWSIARRGEFWSEILDVAEIELSQPARAPFEGEGMLGTRWLPGATLNYARHMLRFDGDAPAIQFRSELGARRTLSRSELRRAVERCAAALWEAGVEHGDRVAGFLPNVPEAVVAMLASASIGAVWSSCSPDFGVQGVLDRFGQIGPKVLFVPDGYSYGGKRHDTLARVREMLPRLDSVKRVVVTRLVSDAPTDGGISGAMSWDDFLETGEQTPLEFAEVPFDYPLYILYSSGTTGVPKCIVHGHGGTLLQHAKEHLLHCDIRAGERVFYYTTCGWMMWNWLVSALGCGATVVLYEGSPMHPASDALWMLAQEERLNLFGTSPKFLAACQKENLRPAQSHDLSALRAVLSTGSPLSAEQFRWVYGNVKSDVQLSSISGGTDIVSCFMLGNPVLPVYAGEIQCRGLGMDVQAWDPDGREVIGEKGELVCASPFPSQPVGFWNDADGSKYRAAYFEHFDGVWRHGDFIEITPHGGVIVFGRSDATLNPGGIRIGTAEIYRIVETIPEILDSIVVGHEANEDVEVALFVVLRAGLTLDAALEGRIRAAIVAGATRRHVPRHIRQVRAIPYTISGKKVELAVQQMLRGEPVKNRAALSNPDALDEYAGLI